METGKRVHNKLVRDGIPAIIEGKEEVVHTRIVTEDREYDALLRDKLVEEAHEVSGAKTRVTLVEELADLMSVRDALLELHGISHDELNAQQQKKDRERGGFGGRIFLISTG